MKSESNTSIHDVLGVSWHSNQEFIVDLGAIVEVMVQPLKRDVLRIIAKILDPLGLCSPVVLRGKLIFQELCRRNIRWDQIIAGDLLDT